MKATTNLKSPVKYYYNNPKTKKKFLLTFDPALFFGLEGTDETLKFVTALVLIVDIIAGWVTHKDKKAGAFSA